jgi:bacteriorhodopsin
MDGILVLSLVYWAAVAVIFLIGLIRLMVLLAKQQPVKPALILLLIAVIMLVIGIGACAAMLSGFSTR